MTLTTALLDRCRDPRIYVRILHHLRQQIDCGALAPGEPIPTIAALCWQFSCTRQTVSRTLRMLADEDLLSRYPGVGYYVRVRREEPGGRPENCLSVRGNAFGLG